MTQRWLLPLCLAFALLFAQQGALLHAVSHLAECEPGHTQHEKHLPHSPVCDKCAAFAAIAGAVHSVAPQFLAANLSYTLPQQPPVANIVADILSPRSRGPPVLL